MFWESLGQPWTILKEDLSYLVLKVWLGGVGLWEGALSVQMRKFHSKCVCVWWGSECIHVCVCVIGNSQVIFFKQPPLLLETCIYHIPMHSRFICYSLQPLSSWYFFSFPAACHINLCPVAAEAVYIVLHIVTNLRNLCLILKFNKQLPDETLYKSPK